MPSRRKWEPKSFASPFGLSRTLPPGWSTVSILEDSRRLLQVFHELCPLVTDYRLAQHAFAEVYMELTERQRSLHDRITGTPTGSEVRVTPEDVIDLMSLMHPTESGFMVALDLITIGQALFRGRILILNP